MDDIIARLEKSRKTVYKYYIYNAILLFFCGILFLIFRYTAPIIFIMFLVATLAFFVIFTLPKKNSFKKSFKHEIVEAVLRTIFTDLYFEPKQGISKKVIADTGMMRMGNRYSSDDFIRGKYKDTGFEQSDVCIQQVTSDGKHTSVTTYFKGRWMIFDFNKNFASDLQVRESGFYYAKRKGGWFSSEEKMAKLDLEDQEFNRCFDVYAQNEHEAYYILTPHIMQSMKNLRDRTDGKLLLCFVKSKLHVGVNSNKNAFEPSILRPVNTAVINSIKDEISIITRFVDELKLYRDIYKH